MPAPFGTTGWSTSKVGFGGYRVDCEAREHREALSLALASGCNLIDTSTNYGDGGSEELVGEVLQELFQQQKLRREEVIVVTKVGYVQGGNLDEAQRREQAGSPYSEMVKVNEDCWHCISPAFLEDQITHSLQRLQLQKLDCVLLHNPEYFLKVHPDANEYYRRIEAAFRHLEEEVQRGRIHFYGISSNTFPETKTHPEFTSLEVVTDLAEKISPQHRFRVIQFPLNLLEPGAALEENNGGTTLIEFACKKGFATLVNRPLNAFSSTGLVRLADFPNHGTKNIAADFKLSMEVATRLEQDFPGRDWVSAQDIAWAHILRQNFDSLSDIDTWRNVLHYRIRPTLATALDTLSLQATCQEWVKNYRTASDALFSDFSAYLEQQSSVVSDKIAGKLDHLIPAIGDSLTLSQKVIRLYLSIPGISCVLVGMRQTAYVRDALDLKQVLPLEACKDALIEFSQEIPELSESVFSEEVSLK